MVDISYYYFVFALLVSLMQLKCVHWISGKVLCTLARPPIPGMVNRLCNSISETMSIYSCNFCWRTRFDTKVIKVNTRWV